MMTPEEKGSLPIRVEKLFYELQDRIFSDIVRRIRKTKKITSTADYQINKLLLLGGSTEFIESQIKELLEISDPEIWEMYDKVCEWEYVRNRDAALDVVQESIVKALAKSDTLRRPEYLKTWFYRILLNESMNHHRRAKRLVPLEDTLLETPVPARDPGERLDLYDAIERLDWKEQTVVRLRFFEDMKLEEIARVTNTNLNTVKSRLYKSLRRLRELTEEEC